MSAVKGPLAWIAGLGLALAPGAAARPADADAAVARARETLAETLRTEPAVFELVSIEPMGHPGAEATLSCRPPLAPEDGTGAPAWTVKLSRSGRTFEVRVAGEESKVCLFGGDRTPVPSLGPRGESGPVEGGLAAQTARAQTDLAGRLDVAASDIEVVEAASVVWPDTSAGCPRPKRTYAQVLTPGVRIRLRAGNRVYQYHGRAGRAPFLCPTPSPIEPARAEVE